MNNINYWQQKAAQEHGLRKDAEQKAQDAINALRANRAVLKKNVDYKNYLETKHDELEKLYANVSNKLRNTVTMLKKAKQLLAVRKAEITALQEENAKLTRALAAKSELLDIEMMHSEELNKKLAHVFRLTAQSMQTPVHYHNDMNDNQFIANLRLIEQQHLK